MKEPNQIDKVELNSWWEIGWLWKASALEW